MMKELLDILLHVRHKGAQRHTLLKSSKRLKEKMLSGAERMESMRENFFPAVAAVRAVKTVKSHYPPSAQTAQTVAPFLLQTLADKGLGAETISNLVSRAPSVLPVLGQFLRHAPCAEAAVSLASLASPDTEMYETLQRCLRDQLAHPFSQPQYQGTREENVVIDASVAAVSAASITSSREDLPPVTGRGAAGAYTRCAPRSCLVSRPMRETPVVIIGAGAAGVLAARALADVGFTNILVLDQSGLIGGVWNQPFLRDASRANPFPLLFERSQLDAAPGSGEAVWQWLHRIATSGIQPFPRLVQARVLEVQPGDLSHTVLYEDARGARHGITVPVVVNAVGVGEPLFPSRPGVMTTDVSAHEAGHRWQEVWTQQQARSYRGRTCVFISLSNSTLEMVKQIQHYQRAGLDIDYQILTHYPDEALAEPRKTVVYQGHKMRLYRCPERLQLLRLAGDLPDVAAAFEQARDEGHIASHVTHWSVEGGERPQVVAVRADGVVHRIPYDELYTLIGYGPRAETLTAMGLRVNHPYLGAVDLDYDGEVQREPGRLGRARLYPGYFCLGIRNAFNMNEVLLPGLLFRLPDLVAGVILRSAEVVAQARSSSSSPCL